jgi:hypothetical protein
VTKKETEFIQKNREFVEDIDIAFNKNATEVDDDKKSLLFHTPLALFDKCKGQYGVANTDGVYKQNE